MKALTDSLFLWLIVALVQNGHCQGRLDVVALLKTCRGGGWGLGQVTDFTRTIFGLVVTYHLQTGGTGGTGDFV